MTRLLVLLAAGACLLPAAAHGAACTPLDCAPSQFTLDHGRLLAVRVSVDRPIRVIDLRTGATRFRLPAGIVVGDSLVTQSDGTLLTWYRLSTGARLADAVLGLRGAFQLIGASQDGARAVLARTQTRSTTFAIVSPRSSRVVELGRGHWGFDALRGDHLVLIRYVRNGYQVRLYDLARNVLVRRPLKDPGESATIGGFPVARASSPDGRYLFTLYVEGDGRAMIHELDLDRATARCIDLPGTGDWSAALTWSLVPDPDGRQLWALAPGYGRVVAIDAVSRRIRRSWRFSSGAWNGATGAAALSPDGSRFALTDAQHVWFLTVGRTLRVRKVAHVAIALGWSPDARRLWVVGERSRVSPLPPG